MGMKMLSMMPRFILDPLLRRMAKLHKTPVDKYRVFIARTVEEYEDAFTLLHIAYVYQGIEAVRGVSMRITPQHVLPESTVLVAYDESSIVGTMTVTLDSPAGLPLEHDYPEKITELRDQGACLVEYGSLAVVKRCWSTGVTTLLNTAAHWWSMKILKATDCVIGVNPKVEPFYRAIYKFRPMGKPQEHAELTAPVLGMVTNLRQAEEFVIRRFRRPMSHGIPFGEAMTTLGRIPGIDIPKDVSNGDLIRWKLPREVFQELFIMKSDRLDSLDPKTKEYLEELRTDETLERRLP